MQTREPKTLITAINRLADALEQQNQILNDIVKYPADMQQPPRILIEVVNMQGPAED